jgi:hypothetical protein
LELDGADERIKRPDVLTTVKRLALVAGPPFRPPEAAGLPVLRDVVSQAEMDSRVDGDQLPSSAESTLLAEAPPQRPPATAEATTANAVPEIHMPGTRSRLMRMKSRGLFANE